MSNLFDLPPLPIPEALPKTPPRPQAPPLPAREPVEAADGQVGGGLIGTKSIKDWKLPADTQRDIKRLIDTAGFKYGN